MGNIGLKARLPIMLFMNSVMKNNTPRFDMRNLSSMYYRCGMKGSVYQCGVVLKGDHPTYILLLPLKYWIDESGN